MTEQWESSQQLQSEESIHRADARIWNWRYLVTAPGLLKQIQIFTYIVAVACIERSGLSTSAVGTFRAVSVAALVTTALLLLCHLYGAVERLQEIPWLKIEFGLCLAWTGLTLVVTSVAVTVGGRASGNWNVSAAPGVRTAGWVSGYLAGTAYAVDAVLKFKATKLFPLCLPSYLGARCNKLSQEDAFTVAIANAGIRRLLVNEVGAVDVLVDSFDLRLFTIEREMTDRGRPSIAVPATEDMYLSGSGSRSRLCFDTAYFRTHDGILKTIQMLTNVIGVICVACSPWKLFGGSIFYNVIALVGFSITFILLTLYVFHIVERCLQINWLYYEFIYCTLWTVLLVISSSIAVASLYPASQAAGVFGYLACLAYGSDSYLKFNAARAGTPGHGASAPH